MFKSQLPISYYKDIAALNEEHGIYVVQHIETKKIYIKKIMPVYAMSVYEQLFKNPVRNVPRIYAMCEEDNTLTVIEEYISGETLQEILDICGSLDAKTVIEYMLELCDIIIMLHSFNPPIIHRDLKPSNIILTEDGRIVLIDLNAAKLMESNQSRDTRLLGTEGFAAPEQFGFGASSPQTDIYAIGTLMTVLLTGSLESDNGIPKLLQSIIAKCTELNPKDRYASASELKAALVKAIKRWYF